MGKVDGLVRCCDERQRCKGANSSKKNVSKMDELQTLPTTNIKQAGNKIGAEGARALSEALKTNTTLQSLGLGGEQEEMRKMDKLQTLPTTNTNKQPTRLEQKEQEH